MIKRLYDSQSCRYLVVIGHSCGSLSIPKPTKAGLFISFYFIFLGYIPIWRPLIFLYKGKEASGQGDENTYPLCRLFLRAHLITRRCRLSRAIQTARNIPSALKSSVPKRCNLPSQWQQWQLPNWSLFLHKLYANDPEKKDKKQIQLTIYR